MRITLTGPDAVVCAGSQGRAQHQVFGLKVTADGKVTAYTIRLTPDAETPAPAEAGAV